MSVFYRTKAGVFYRTKPGWVRSKANPICEKIKLIAVEPQPRQRIHSVRAGVVNGLEEGVQPLSALARLASIVESSEDAIIGKDLSGTIVSWNRGAIAVYGYAPQEAIGQSINMLVPLDRADEEQAVLAKIRTGERLQHFETIRVRKNGTPIHVSLTISPVWEDGTIVGASHIARDISDRKHLEGANARLAAIVESSDDAIVSKDLNGIIQTWNTGAEQVYGHSHAEAVGRNIAFLLPHDRAREEQEILARLRLGERVQHFETTRLRKDGSLIHVSLTLSPIRDVSGQVVGVSHVARDITERKNLEVQMRQTQRLESLGVLAGGIAHDFNNLLTGIIGNASLVTEMLPSQDPARSFLDNLLLAAQRAADLTAQLLAYSGRGQFVVGPVNLTKRDLRESISSSAPPFRRLFPSTWSSNPTCPWWKPTATRCSSCS